MKRRKLCSLLLASSLILSSLSSSMGAYAEDVNDTTVSQKDDNPNETVISTEDSSVQILTEEEMQKLGITEFTSENTNNEEITESFEEETTTEETQIEETTNTKEVINDSTEDITSEDQEEVTEEVTKENSEDISTEEITEEATSEETSEESSEDISEETSEEVTTEEVVKEPSFTEKVEGVSTSGLDFSSMELLVGTEDSSIFTWDTQVISEYNGVYLVRFDNIQTTENAYTYYYKIADFVSTNNTFKVADEESVKNESKEDLSTDLSNLNQSDDALSILNDLDATKTPDKTIALIDTGVNANDLIDSVSVIGENVSDDNGHGTQMYQYIKKEAPNAKILSIKALDSNGKGQASNIYAAIQYAIESKVDIINLSISSYNIEENNIVVQAIEEAISNGIKVIGAAGNSDAHAKYFIPGCVKDAIIVGCLNNDGSLRGNSNYGYTVDYFIIDANSTSEAAAIFTGRIISDNMKDGKIVANDASNLTLYDEFFEYADDSNFYTQGNTDTITVNGTNYIVDRTISFSGKRGSGYTESKYFPYFDGSTWEGDASYYIYGWKTIPKTVKEDGTTWDADDVYIGDMFPANSVSITGIDSSTGSVATGTYEPKFFCSDAYNYTSPTTDTITKSLYRTQSYTTSGTGRWFVDNGSLYVPYANWNIGTVTSDSTHGKKSYTQALGIYAYIKYSGTTDVYYYAAIKKVQTNDYSKSLDDAVFDVYINGKTGSNYVGQVKSGHYGGYKSDRTGWTATRWDDYRPDSYSGYAIMYLGKYSSTDTKPRVYIQETTPPSGYGMPDNVEGYNEPYEISVFKGDSAGTTAVQSAMEWANNDSHTWKNYRKQYYAIIYKTSSSEYLNGVDFDVQVNSEPSQSKRMETGYMTTWGSSTYKDFRRTSGSEAVSWGKDSRNYDVNIARKNGFAIMYIGDSSKYSSKPTVQVKENWSGTGESCDSISATSGTTVNASDYVHDTSWHDAYVYEAYGNNVSNFITASNATKIDNVHGQDYYVVIQKKTNCKDSNGYDLYLYNLPIELTISGGTLVSGQSIQHTTIWTGWASDLTNSNKTYYTNSARYNNGASSITWKGQSITTRNDLAIAYLGKYTKAPTVQYKESWGTSDDVHLVTMYYKSTNTKSSPSDFTFTTADNTASISTSVSDAIENHLNTLTNNKLDDYYVVIEKDTDVENMYLYNLPITVTTKLDTNGDGTLNKEYSRTVRTGYATDITNGSTVETGYANATSNPTWGNITIQRHNGKAYVYLGKSATKPSVTYTEAWTSNNDNVYLLSEKSSLPSDYPKEKVSEWVVDTKNYTATASNVFIQTSGTLNTSLKETLSNKQLIAYYAQIIKTDKDGNILEGVPFRYQISTDGGTSWGNPSTIRKTDENGIITVDTGKVYEKTATVPLIRWIEQSWGSNTDNKIYLHDTNGRHQVDNAKYIVTSNNLPSNDGIKMNTVKPENSSFSYKNNEYYPYYIAVKKVDDEGNILQNVPIQISYTGGAASPSYSGTVVKTNDNGIALFKIPYTEHFNDSSTVNLTEVWGQTGYKDNAILVYKENGQTKQKSVSYTKYKHNWAVTKQSIYKTEIEALSGTHPITAENIEYHYFYVSLNKVSIGAGNKDMTDTQYALFWNGTNAFNWSKSNDKDKMIVFTLDKNGKVSTVTNGDSGINGYYAIHYREGNGTDPDVVTGTDSNKYLKITVYKDKDSQGTTWEAQNGIDKLTGKNNPFYIREVHANGNHELNPNTMKVELTENEYTLVKGDENDLNNPLTNVETVYITMSMKKSNEGQNYSMEGIRYNLAHVKDGKTTIIATFTLAADGSVASIVKANLKVDGHGTMNVDAPGKQLKITFDDGRDVTDEKNFGYFILYETIPENNDYYEMNTEKTKINSSDLTHGANITVTATAHQDTSDPNQYKDALTDTSFTPYYLVIDKTIVDVNQNAFSVNGIPFNITINNGNESITKQVETGSYYNFDTKESQSIKTYDNNGTKLTDQSFTFTLTKNGSAIKDTTNADVQYKTIRKDGRIIVYLGTYQKNKDGSCPITVDVEENWTNETADKVNANGTITKITSENYICDYESTGVEPVEFNKNTSGSITTFNITDTKTLNVENIESTTAIKLVKTSGDNTSSTTYQGTHNVTKTNGDTNCPNENYSLKGATYEVYNKLTNKLVATLVCDANGVTQTKDISVDFLSDNQERAPKEYYAIETKAGKNYKKNPNQINFTVTADNDKNHPYVIETFDEIDFDPIGMNVTKVDSATNEYINPETDIQAEYLVSYYPADVSKHYTVDQLKALDIQPITWPVKLSKDDSGVYGANLHIDDESMGYVIIEETKAPTGFEIDDSQYVMTLVDGNTIIELDKNEIPLIILDREDSTDPDAWIHAYLWRNNQRYQLNTNTSESITITASDSFNPTFDSVSVSNTTGTHVGRVNNETLSTDSITETFIIKDVPLDITFTYKATLMDITSNTVVKTSKSVASDGNRIIETYKSTGLDEQSFNIDLGTFTPVAGHTYATVVEIYGKDRDGNIVKRYSHNEDYSVETQKVYYPSMSTSIISNSTNTQAGALIANEKVTDTITYSNFTVGTNVVFSGTLYDLTNNTKINEIPVTKEVTIDDKTSTDMVFTYDARGLKGHTLAAVVTASVNSEVVIAHNLNKSEISEMVYYPDVNTELLASTNTHLGSVQANETAVETVNFKNVPEGVDVVAVGTLYDVTAKKNVGSTITSDPKASTGLGQQTITLPAFTYDASGLAGHTLSAKVEIKVGNVVIGTHNDDYSDVKETIYYPTVATDLVSGNTNTQLGSKSKTETAIETVTYTNVPKDTTITLIGELWNTKTNEIITLANGKTQATATSKSNGLDENKATINFTYDSTGLDDTVIAAKVFVKLGNNDITKHNDDLKDTREMVYYPKLSTELLSIYGNKYYKVGKVNTTEDEKETARETVTFKGIPKDVEVTYYAELRDLSNSNAIVKLSNGTNNVITKTVKSTGLGEQSFNIVFEYNSMNLANHTISAKVTAKIGDNLIGTHNEDLTDLKETIYYPNGHTSAADVDTTTKLVSKSETAKVYDDFIFSNLVKGISYKLTGTLHKRDKNGKDLGVLEDSKGNAISKTITFTIDADGKINANGAESATVTSSTEETVSGTIRVLFTVDSTLLEGITTTAFETVSVEDYDIFVHANIDDKDQQVHFMKLETDLVSDKTGTNVAALVREDIVKDTLTFEKVPYGSTVVFNGTMMDKDAKSELIINGNKVTGTVTLTVDNNGNVSTSSGVQTEVTGTKDSKTNTVSGTIVLTYKYDSSKLNNKTLVSFVTATTNEKTVVVHDKYDDARETIYYPDIHTNANDINTKTNVATLGLTKVVDTVTLNNLVCGKTYQVVGTIHIKDEANGNPVLKLNGEDVTKKATITVAADGTVTLDNAENAQFTVTDGAIDGTVDIVFDVDTSSILGKDIVAFEKLLTEPVELVAHENINDKDQTVHVPDGGTTAMDAQTKDHVGTVLEDGKVTLPDTVHLDNIAVGHTYHIEGILMDKDTEESVKIDGKEVTASADFTVTANGTVTSVNTVENVTDGTNEDTVSFDIILDFIFASKDLKGKDVVVFETGYFVKTNADQTTTNVKIFEENDITNLDQTVHFPEVSTIATDDTYQNHVGIASETESITEKSILTNLVFGMTYEVKATVMDQLTGEALKDKSGNEVTKTAVVTISDDGKTVTAVEKGTDTQLVVTIDRVDEDDHCIDITVDIPIVFDSTGTNGKSIVLFEDLSHNDIIVKSHHDIDDKDEQIHYFELILLKKGLNDPTVVEFTLTQNGSTMKYSKMEDGSYIIDPNGTITVLNPDSEGYVHIKGFNADSYVLTEIKTEDGKNLLKDPITIKFVADDSDKDNIIQGLEVAVNDTKALIVSTDPEKPYSIELDVTNSESIKLMTGGSGTYMFYILTLLILLAAGVSVVIYRKRRKNQ